MADESPWRRPQVCDDAEALMRWEGTDIDKCMAGFAVRPRARPPCQCTCACLCVRACVRACVCMLHVAQVLHAVRDAMERRRLCQQLVKLIEPLHGREECAAGRTYHLTLLVATTAFTV